MYFFNQLLYIDTKNLLMDIRTYLLLIAIVLILAVVRYSIQIVPQGSEHIVERFGRYSKTIKPGVNLIIPFMDTIRSEISMMETLIQIGRQEVISKDNALLMVDGIAFYQIVNAKNVTYVVNNFRSSLENVIMTNIRTVMGSLDLDEILSNREIINSRLLNVLDEITGPWGLKVVRVELKDITPPSDLLEALAKQIKAEREKRALILKSEGIKASDILQAEGQGAAKVLAAEAQKKKIILESEALQTKMLLKADAVKNYKIKIAEANERQALADALTVERVSVAVRDGNDKAVNYIVAQKYIKSIEKLSDSTNSKLILMPIESAKAIGALGGITELLNNLKADGEDSKTNIKNEEK